MFLKLQAAGYSSLAMDPAPHVTGDDNSRVNADGKRRVYDEEGYQVRVDVLCIRSSSLDKILLVSCNTSKNWTTPGGGVNPNESTQEAAFREAFEEAGVTGHLHSKLNKIYYNEERKARTEVFIIIVDTIHQSWPEDYRKRKWFTLSEALIVLDEKKKETFSDACLSLQSNMSKI
jgi:diphosphoinositol-polyphosphate diphosphatase